MAGNRPTALITGASSGIGRSYALQLAEQGTHDLLLVARRMERLGEVRETIEQGGSNPDRKHTPSVAVFQADLSQPDQLSALLDHVTREGIEVDVLINAAGFGTLGEFGRADMEREAIMIDLNCLVPLRLIRGVLGSMEQRGRGVIINVSSIGAFQPAPYMAAYGASKTFLLHFSLALAEEIADKGVRVLAHCPGPTSTEFHLVAGLPEDMSPIPAMSPDAAVREALRALERSKRMLVNGRINRWLVRLGRLMSLQRSAKVAKNMILSRWSPPESS